MEAGKKWFLQVLKLKDFAVPLSDRNFTKFVSDRPRLYTAAIMFTALGERYSVAFAKRLPNISHELRSFILINTI